jgi:hypothetical protein
MADLRKKSGGIIGCRSGGTRRLVEPRAERARDNRRGDMDRRRYRLPASIERVDIVQRPVLKDAALRSSLAPCGDQIEQNDAELVF